MSEHSEEARAPRSAANGNLPAFPAEEAALDARNALIVAIVTLLILLPTLIVPLGPDQSALACTGRRLLRGDPSYFDLTFMFPASSLLYATAMRILGEAAVSIRAMDVAWSLATALALYALARQLFDRKVASLAAIAYSLVYVEKTYWVYAETDGLLNLPLLLALLFWLRSARRQQAAWAGLAGFCLGAAIAFRISSVAALVCFPVIFAVAVPLGGAVPPGGAGGTRERSLFFRAALLTIVGSLVAVACVGFLIFRNVNDLHDFVTVWTRLVPYHVTREAEPGSPVVLRGVLSALFFFLIDSNHFIALCGVVGTLNVLTGWRARREYALLIAYAFATLLMASAQRRFEPYHWLPTMPAWCLIAASVLELRHELMRMDERRRKVILTAYGLLAVVVFPFSLRREAGRWNDLVYYVRSPSTRESYRERFHTDPPHIAFSASQELQAARYVARRTRPGDRLFLWGFAPSVYFLAGRDTPARLMYHVHAEAPTIPSRWREDYINAIMASRPPFIIIRRDKKPTTPGQRYFDDTPNLDALPKLRDFVARNYFVDREFGYLIVWQQKRRS